MSATSGPEFRDKIQSLGLLGKRGTSNTTVVPNVDKPGIAGTTTEHWDGRTDATAMPDTVVIRKRTRSGA